MGSSNWKIGHVIKPLKTDHLEIVLYTKLPPVKKSVTFLDPYFDQLALFFKLLGNFRHYLKVRVLISYLSAMVKRGKVVRCDYSPFSYILNFLVYMYRPPKK